MRSVGQVTTDSHFFFNVHLDIMYSIFSESFTNSALSETRTLQMCVTSTRKSIPEACLWRSRGRTSASPGDQYPRWLCTVCFGWNRAQTFAERGAVWADSCESPSCLVKQRRSTSCSPSSGRGEEKNNWTGWRLRRTKGLDIQMYYWQVYCRLPQFTQ